MVGLGAQREVEQIERGQVRGQCAEHRLLPDDDGEVRGVMIAVPVMLVKIEVLMSINHDGRLKRYLEIPTARCVLQSTVLK